MSERTCSVDDCTRVHYGRGWCQLHYHRVRKHGSPDGKYQRRTPEPCKIGDCDRPANVPGTAWGWCSRHYQRWQRYGDPLGQHEHEPVVGIAPCLIEGCEELIIARGWCVKHYTRYLRFGEPEARLRGEVRDGCRICPRCGVDKPVVAFGKAQAYCKPCSAAITGEYRAANPPTLVVGESGECRCCGTVFMANKRRSTYCSRACFQAYRHKADWKNQANRRARLASAFVEQFDRIEIFERDGWICQICAALVDPDAPRYSYSVPSIDHIIPIARGGKHSRANVQTACLGCNVRKGVRLSA